MAYTYFATCSIASIQDNQSVPLEKWQYTYDGNNRLTSDCLLDTGGACTAPTPYGYDYDTGNLVTIGNNTLSYTAHAHLHAVTSTTGGGVYTYDANGNQITRTVGGVSYTLAYNEENRLTGITGGSLAASYIYDGDGNRVKTVVNGVTTIYIGNYYEVINPGASQVVKKYYYAGGTRVAMSENGVIRYFVTDHLGSTTKLINTDGSEYSAMRYLAWGSDRLTPPDIGTDFKYTGQREAEAGLYFYNARYYDPEIGRFIQADTLIPEPGNPIAWDRYSYVMNNPINYTDPSGHIRTDPGAPGSKRDKKKVEKDLFASLKVISKNANWALQTFTDFTLYKSSGWPYRTSFRVYADASVVVDNSSVLTAGPRSSIYENLGFSPDGLKIENEHFSLGIPDLSVFGKSIDYSSKFPPLKIGQVNINSKIGVQGIFRPGNDIAYSGAKLAVVVAVYTPELIIAMTPYVERVTQIFNNLKIKPCVDNSC